MAPFYSFTMKSIDEVDQSLSEYKGKVLLVVNTASKCGYTPQYEEMEMLYEKYNAKGFEVLAFPANNFLWQEPGSNTEIKNFCTLNYHTTFPIFAKISVKGKEIHPLYKYLTTESPFKGAIKWNFNKFLINKEGEVVHRFDSSVKPMSKEITEAIEKWL